jgi:hypothetical protein
VLRRFEVSRLAAKNRVAIVAHANNLTNHQVRLPGWGFSSVDTIPVEQGRVIYAGLEFSADKR